MLNGREILNEMKRVSGEISDTYSFQSAKIKNSSLKNGIRYYEMAINKFLGNSIIKRLENLRFDSDDRIRERLRPDCGAGEGQWVDVSGMIAPKSEVEALLDDVESGKVADVRSLHQRFVSIHSDYYNYEWTWAYNLIKPFYGTDPEMITAEDVIRIVEQWKDSVVGLDRLVYEDARKEFSLGSMTGFGADGDSEQKNRDFMEVRGCQFDSNPFVLETLNHIKVKTALGDELIGRLRDI